MQLLHCAIATMVRRPAPALPAGPFGRFLYRNQMCWLSRIRLSYVTLSLRLFLCLGLLVGTVQAQDTVAGESPPLNIVYIGDSITFGSTTPDPATQSSAKRCTEALHAKLGSRPVYMADEGFPGRTTADYLPSHKELFDQATAAAQKLQAAHPGLLLFSIMLGANDSANRGSRPQDVPTPSTQYEANLRAIVDQLLLDFPASKIVIHHLTWYSPSTHTGWIMGQQGLDRVKSYLPRVDDLVRDEATVHPGCVFLGDTASFSDFERNHETNMTHEMGVDGVYYLHPNPAGAIVLGNFWAQAILSDGSLK
jgi:GDSL-like Lipase/Acylhydrolase family